MNEKIIASAVIMTLLASMFLVAIQVISAGTLEVGPGKPYSTIQAAIDAAGSGDTIMVYLATYSEDVTVTKGLALTAESGVKIVGGIWIKDIHNFLDPIKVENFIIENGTSIDATHDYGIKISGDIGAGADQAIVDMHIVNNTFINCGKTDDVTAEIWWNAAVFFDANHFGALGNRYDTIFMATGEISNNTIVNNLVDPAKRTQLGIGVRSGRNMKINYNTISGNVAEGIHHWGPVNTTNIGDYEIDHNHIDLTSWIGDPIGNNPRGIWSYAPQSSISYNTVISKWIGIVLTYWDDTYWGGGSAGDNLALTVGHNVIHPPAGGNMSVGLRISGSDSQITDNEIHGATDNVTGYGVGLLFEGFGYPEWGERTECSNNTFTRNHIHDNYDGIWTWAPPYNNTFDNEFHYNNIENNINSGMTNNNNGTIVDARFNWWDDSSGPTHSSNLGGVGEVISDYVDYNPWLGDPFEITPRTYHVNPTGTIQEAIDEASSGDSIIVAVGTYAGAIVDKDVMISGTSGSGSIITSGVPYKIGSSLYTAFRLDDTADGAEIRDFIINCNSSEGFYFAVFSRNADDVVIDSLTVNDAVQGITDWGGSNWEITNNVLNDTEAAGGGGIAIWLGVFPPSYPVCSGNLIQGNTITATATAPDYTCPGIGVGLDLRWGAYHDLTGSEDISNNQIINNSITAPGALNGVGIEIGVLGLEGNTTQIEATLGLIHDNTIGDNTIDGADMGVYFYTVTDLTIQQNVIKNCNEGIHIKDGSSGNIINYNNIFGNAIGLNNTAETPVDATLNWWGDSSGPSGVGLGTGDWVSENVDFDPWLSCYQPQVETKIYISPFVVEEYAFAGIEGVTFDIYVRIQQVEDLYGFEFNVTWDNSLIKLVGVEYESQLYQIWGTYWTAPRNMTDTGWYQLVALALAPAVGLSGTGTLAKLTFRVEYGPCYIEPDYQLQTRIHFATVKLSNSSAQPICAQVQDGKYIIYAIRPSLKVLPGTITCRKLDEEFTVEINLIDAFKVCGFEFEIEYNAELLGLVDVQWGDLSSFLPGPYITYNYTVDELNGLISFHLLENVTAGAPLASGDGTLAEITLKVIKTKVWKNCPEWTNYIEDSIAFREGDITVMCPDVHHLTGELVNVVDAEYRFESIQGDIDTNGIVDIFDIAAVASYYNIEKGDPEYISDFDLNCDDIIDLYDLVTIAVNFGYQYDP